MSAGGIGRWDQGSTGDDWPSFGSWVALAIEFVRAFNRLANASRSRPSWRNGLPAVFSVSCGKRSEFSISVSRASPVQRYTLRP